MYELHIKGFKTKEQAKQFWSWYEGQGEQQAQIWFECRKDEGLLDTDWMPADIKAGMKWNGNVLETAVKIIGESNA